MSKLVAMREAVREDPDLLPEEKETTLRFAKDQDTAAVYTAEAGLARRLLAHAAVNVEGLTVLEEEEARREVDPDDWGGGDIVGVRARLPVGALKVQRTPRSAGGHAQVVSEKAVHEVVPDA
ncbi:MAG: hypothetical protein ABEH58_06150 [Haloplanus sp.]